MKFYTGFTFVCGKKIDCNEIHPYISFVPVRINFIWALSYFPLLFQIISFILLRNISGWLRSRFSLLFAWFGKISLEVTIVVHFLVRLARAHQSNSLLL